MTMPPWLDLEKWNCTTTITSPTTIVLGQLYAVSQRKNPPKVALIWVIFQAAAMDHGVEIKHENLPTMNQMNKGEISRTIFQFFILSFIFKSNKKKNTYWKKRVSKFFQKHFGLGRFQVRYESLSIRTLPATYKVDFSWDETTFFIGQNPTRIWQFDKFKCHSYHRS